MNIGDKFNRLTYFRDTKKRGSNGSIIGVWKCDCGTEKEIRNDCVKDGTTKACGCMLKEFASIKGKNTKGRINSPESIKKMADSLRGRVCPTKGIKRPHCSGTNHPCWKGGITKETMKIRASIEYRDWRNAVFIRDNYTCVFCLKRGSGDLNADHICPFSLFPELRLDINNGRTLCVGCHKKTYSYANKRMKIEDFLTKHGEN